MIERVAENIKTRIPMTQAVNNEGGSTTEHVFACKILAENALYSEDYTTNILPLDTWKAFDTVDREKLLNIINKVIGDDELHILKIMVKDVKIQVRVGKTGTADSH